MKTKTKRILKLNNMKKNFIFIAAIIQAVFAVAMIANKNPSIHWWAIAPIMACGVLLILKTDEDE